MKRWSVIFKILGNINRLKIIKLLSAGRAVSVKNIADSLNISTKSTSKHLIILGNFDILENTGKDGHVYYSINPKMPEDVRKIVRSII